MFTPFSMEFEFCFWYFKKRLKNCGGLQSLSFPRFQPSASNRIFNFHPFVQVWYKRSGFAFIVRIWTVLYEASTLQALLPLGRRTSSLSSHKGTSFLIHNFSVAQTDYCSSFPLSISSKGDFPSLPGCSSCYMSTS